MKKANTKDIIDNLVKEEKKPPKPKGRPPKGDESRKQVTFRLRPSTIEKIKQEAEKTGLSQSDLLEFIINYGRI